MIKEFVTGYGGSVYTYVPLGSFPNNLLFVNGALYFSIRNSRKEHEFWKSDGTTNGTVLIKNIAEATETSLANENMGFFTNANGTLYLTAFNGTNGIELWKSDGTEAGTVLVKDIWDGSGSSVPRYLTNVNGTLFFSANDNSKGDELWKSDGTEAGTVLVKDINTGYYDPIYGTLYESSSPIYLTNINGVLYFIANTSIGTELWKSDGTAAGTVLVKDIRVGSGSSNPENLSNINGTLYFSAYDGTNNALWKSDGTTGGTVLIKTGRALNLTNVNGTLYYATDDATNGYALWKSDGTTTGTIKLKDFYFGNCNCASYYNPSYLTNINGTLFFQARSGNNSALWKSDGTTAGTVVIPGTTAIPLSSPDNLVNVNGTLFFAAYVANTSTNISGKELWKSDGTTAVFVKDINPGISGSFPDNLTNVNGTLYFKANNGTNGYELWKSDGTAAGTVMVKDIYPWSYTSNGLGSEINYLTNVNGTLFFGANDGIHGLELWKYTPPNCPTSLPLTSPTDDASSGTILKQASAATGNIAATNKITGIANVTYEAKSIQLNPGFKADNGTVFKAQVGGCL